jgi:3-deoxy-D-manno-octulosonic-acid transferase
MLANLVYLSALILLSPWVAYRCLRHGRYRRGVGQKLFGLSATRAQRLNDGADRCVWLHAVSVGEVNLIGRIVASIQRSRPELRVVVSTSTDTGFDLACERLGSDRVFFCPLDFSWAVRRTLRNLRPELLVLAELELWPNLISQTRRSGREVIVINGRLSHRSAAGYQRLRWLTQSIFAALSRVECQDETSAKNFIDCGAPPDRVHVSGSLKFDDAPTNRDCEQVQSRLLWAGIDPWQVVWVVGSTQEGEEQTALDVYQTLSVEHRELRLILVPRHPERFDRVAELIERRGLKAHRRSRDGSQQHLDWTADRVLLIDTIGELRHWWGVGQIATVGGSFGDRGGQNMLEPAGYGAAVSFGPNTRNFQEIADRLIHAGGAVRVNDGAELERFVRRCLTDIPAADALGVAARQVIAQHQGATKRMVRAILAALPGQVADARSGKAA